MFIQKKRIRNIERYITEFDGRRICISHTIPNDKKLETIGFSKAKNIGEKVLPSIVGPITRFNAKGKSIPDKKSPKEIAYRQICWTRNKWTGRGTSEKITEIREIEYKRYKRIFTPPPSIELKIAQNTNKNKLIVSPIITLEEKNKTDIVHCINLFLELFGNCEIINEKLDSLIKAKTIRLNWELLPKGKYPWEKLEPRINSALKIKCHKKGNEVVFKERFKVITDKSPDVVAFGKAGFNGYIIFGFNKKNIYILESTQCNNATYILNKDWEEISQLTKAEILNDKLHIDRIIHKMTWKDKINKYLL